MVSEDCVVPECGGSCEDSLFCSRHDKLLRTANHVPMIVLTATPYVLYFFALILFFMGLREGNIGLLGLAVLSNVMTWFGSIFLATEFNEVKE